MSAPTPSEAQIDAALDATVCDGESVRFYLEAYAFANDDEVTCRIMTREVIATAIRAALGATPSEAVRVAVQELTATQKIELAGAFANKDARAKAFELIDRVDRLVAAKYAVVTSAAGRVVADAITGEAPAGYALVPLEAFAALAALSLHVGDAAFDVEAMLKACVPGGDHCDPQQVADALRAYLGATPAKGPAQTHKEKADGPDR